MNLAHGNLADPCVANHQRFLDRADHHDPGCPVRQSDGGACNGPEYIDDRHRAGRPLSTFQETVDRYFHPKL
jgi:hypothetical protein